MRPSDVLSQHRLRHSLPFFGCAETDRAAFYVVEYLERQGDRWDCPFDLQDVRSYCFTGSDADWMSLIHHYHGSQACLMVKWLDKNLNGNLKGGYVVSREFIERVTQGDAPDIAKIEDIIRAATVKSYVKLGRILPGVRMDDVMITYNDKTTDILYVVVFSDVIFDNKFTAGSLDVVIDMLCKAGDKTSADKVTQSVDFSRTPNSSEADMRLDITVLRGHLSRPESKETKAEVLSEIIVESLKYAAK